jgi:hypothetical protein
MSTKFWSENLKVGDYAEDIGVDGRIILDWILGMESGNVWIGFIWLRTRTSGRALVNTVMNLRVS